MKRWLVVGTAALTAFACWMAVVVFAAREGWFRPSPPEINDTAAFLH